MDSRSKFSESNGGVELCHDEQGKPLQGELVTEEGMILRFKGGLLDGDVYTAAGRSVALPAVESPGHVEWWRAGRLHRDHGLPAVISKNFTIWEWWVNGYRV
jgi:hypothetical protein